MQLIAQNNYNQIIYDQVKILETIDYTTMTLNSASTRGFAVCIAC